MFTEKRHWKHWHGIGNKSKGRIVRPIDRGNCRRTALHQDRLKPNYCGGANDRIINVKWTPQCLSNYLLDAIIPMMTFTVLIQSVPHFVRDIPCLRFRRKMFFFLNSNNDNVPHLSNSIQTHLLYKNLHKKWEIY